MDLAVFLPQSQSEKPAKRGKSMKSDFYDKEIYRKRPVTKEEAEAQLVALMDDLSIREGRMIGKLLLVAAIVVALEIVVALVLHFMGIDPSRFALWVGVIDVVLGAFVFGGPISKLSSYRKSYRRVKEKVLAGTFDKDIVEYTNQMLDAALDDKNKGK